MSNIKNNRIFDYMLVLIFITLLFTPVVRALPEPPEISADSAILVESRRGQVLYAKNPDKKLHISSACKIMTALLTIENGNLDSEVTISKESANVEGSHLFLEVGEKYHVEDLVYAIVLTSANDAALALAEHVAGDTQEFVKMMNNKAREINLKSTHFENATGLYNESQYTTARDISVLMKYALENSTFNYIFSWKIRPWVDGSKRQVLLNQNNMLWKYDNVDGGKTGFNDPDKHTAITTVTRNSQRLICIILDSPPENVYEDSADILDYGFDNFRTDVLVSENRPLKSIFIGDMEVNLVSREDIVYTFPVGENYIKQDIEFNIVQDLAPPVTKDTVIGTARYTLNDGTIVEVTLYPDKEVKAPETISSYFISRLKENRDLLYIIGILIFIEAVLLLYHILRLIKKLFICIKNKINKNKIKS